MSRKKHLEFEINLIPMIDLLSVCICFLLLTAVWLHVGAMNVKQAVGGQAAADTEKKPTVWVQMGGEGDVSFEVRDSRVPARLAKMKLSGKEGRPDQEAVKKYALELKSVEPGLTTALIQPQAASLYEDIIDTMDTLKKEGLIDLGVTPL
ncbi:MAG: biopolymer transporter ExbD [Bdellovibrionales bacterium]|jgi:biopolymer transport protein ExbD|nr:biopolymer transporter ExbD [Bdellovibrionales bacterium]